MKKAIVVACCVIISGCSLFAKPSNTEIIQLDRTTEDHPANQGVLINYDVSRRGAFMIDKSKLKNREIIFCAEPSPDAATNSSQKVASNGGSGGFMSLFFGDKGGEENATTVNDEFNGRSQTVLMLREALYRLCEMSANHSDLSTSDIKAMYLKVLEQVPEVAKTERAVAEADKAKADKKNEELKNDKENKKNEKK